MIEIDWAQPQDRDEIQTFLAQRMPKIPFERWRNILDCRWNHSNDHYGVLVRENGVLAGFLGIVFADRDFAGQPHRTGNITSWFLEKHLRRGGLGQDMLALITSEPSVTYTATSANFRSGALLQKIGWDLLDDTRLFWRAEKNPAVPVGTCQLNSTKQALDGLLLPAEQRLVDDHAGLNFTPHLLTTSQGERLFFITYMKIKGEENTRHHEILYTSDPDLLARHIQMIANQLAKAPNSLLSSDKRFLAKAVAVSNAQPLKVARYYKPYNNLPAKSIDFLYGEVILLDLKVY